MKKIPIAFKIIGIILVIILAQAIGIISKSFVDLWTKKVEKNETFKETEFSTVKVGSSNLVVSTPYKMTFKEPKMPAEMLNQFEKIEVFEFEKNDVIEGSTTYIKWKPEYTFDVENAAEGSIQKVKKLEGVDSVSYNKSLIQDYLLEKCYFDAIMYRYSKKVYIRGVTIKQGQNSWLIMAITTNISNDSLMKKIVESTKLVN